MWSSWEICHVSLSDITFCFKRSCLFWNGTWPWKSSQGFFFCMTFFVAVEWRNELRQKQVILSWCLWRVARVRLKTSFDDQPAISPFLEVHAVFFQVSLWTGRGEGKGGKEKREPVEIGVEMPKDFDFHVPVIDVMFKLTYWVASTTTAANFE